NFAQVVRDDYCFVDKSLFIKQILDGGDGVTLITRPRRFGKTINMSMLRCFLQAAGGCRDAMNRVSTTAEHSAENDLFADLAISRAGDGYQQERGKRPVIFISFRAVKELEWEPAFRRMSALLAKLVETNCQEAPMERLTRTQQRTLEKIARQQALPDECESTLALLTELLTLRHEGMTPWVLIDEYDAPMQAAYQYNYYAPMRNLMKGLLGDCLKDNDFLHRAVITGILRVAKEDIFSDLNNPGIYGVSQDRFASSFGFTETEVKELLSGRDMADRLDAVRDWYDGYRVGADEPVTIYNPWSVISYVANPTQTPRPHWVNTSSNHLVHHLLTQADAGVKRGLRQLLDERNPVTIQRVQQNVPLQELESDPENLWGLLLASGYLTLHPRGREGKENTARESALCIPNKEVREVYDTLAHKWLRGNKGGDGASLLDALVAGDVEEFAEGFVQLMRKSISYFDTAGDEPERFYHGFVLGMVHHLHDRYVIRSERESGLGRYDLALEPKEKSMPGFVLEFKKAPRVDGTLEQAAAKALAQIKEREYHADLLHRGVETVVVLGLAFRGKEVAVTYEQVNKANR
ncbi:MAG: AAA family ATPase, partial [Myxococcota bacterium]